MKLSSHFIRIVIIFLFLSCTMPSGNNQTATWEVSYSLPLANITVSVGDILDELVLDSSITIEDPDQDSSSLGDTMTLNYRTIDTALYTFNLFNQQSLNQTTSMNSLTITELPLLTNLIPLNDFFTIDSLGNGSITLTDELHSEHFEQIRFDSRPDSATVIITNTTDSMTFDSIHLSLTSDNNSFLTEFITSPILPGESIRISFPVEDLYITNSIDFDLTASLSEITDNLETEGIEVALDLNGLQPLEAKMNLRYLDYQFLYSADIPIANDSFTVIYGDLGILNVPISIDNPFPISLTVETILPSVIDRNYALTNNITKIEQIPVSEAELIQKGNQIFSISEGVNDIIIAVENCRILTEQTAYGLSTIPVEITGHIQSTDSIVEFSNWKEATISTLQCQVECKELEGYYSEESYYLGKTEAFSMPLSETGDFNEQLRDKVKLTENDLTATIDFEFGDNSYISSMKFWCILEMFCSDSIVLDTFFWVMNDIQNDQEETFQFNSTTMVNAFPDSILYRVDYSFPKSSVVHFRDSLFKNEDGQTKLVIPVNFDLSLTNSFVWAIEDTVLLDLGMYALPIHFDNNWYNPLIDKSFYLNYILQNETNFEGKLFALAGDHEYLDQLDSISDDLMRDMFHTGEFEDNLIPLLGEEGVTLPARSNSSIDTILLTTDYLHDILYSDTLLLKQWLLITPTESDALLDTDFLTLIASFTLSGTQSTDLFNQE